MYNYSDCDHLVYHGLVDNVFFNGNEEGKAAARNTLGAADAGDVDQRLNGKVDKSALLDAGLKNLTWAVSRSEITVTTVEDPLKAQRPSGTNTRYWGEFAGCPYFYHDKLYRVTFGTTVYSNLVCRYGYLIDENKGSVIGPDTSVGGSWQALGNLHLYDSRHADTGEDFCMLYVEHAGMHDGGGYYYSSTVGNGILFTRSAMSIKIKIETASFDKENIPKALLNNFGRGDDLYTLLQNSSYVATSIGAANIVTGRGAVAVGFSNIATGQGAIAVNSNNNSTGQGSFAEGYGTLASGMNSHSEGHTTTASGNYSHAEGFDTKSSSSNSHAEGIQSQARGTASHAEGDTTIATGYGAHAEGGFTTASGQNAHAEGGYAGSESHENGSQALGYSSHAEGGGTVASASCSHSEGFKTIASGNNSHAEGTSTTASGQNAHAEGQYTEAGGWAHAEGQVTTAMARVSHVEGTSNNIHETQVGLHVQGVNADTPTEAGTRTTFVNFPDGTSATRVLGKYAHIVGNGTDPNHRSNAHTLDWSGNAWFAGNGDFAGGSIKVGNTTLTENQLQALLALLG